MPLYLGKSGTIYPLREMHCSVSGTIYPFYRMYAGIGGEVRELFAGVQLEQIPLSIEGTGKGVDLTWGPFYGYEYSLSIAQDGGSGYAQAGYRVYGLFEGDTIYLDSSTCGDYFDSVLVDNGKETKLTKRNTTYVKKAGENYIDLMCQCFLGENGANWVIWYLYGLQINDRVIV